MTVVPQSATKGGKKTLAAILAAVGVIALLLATVAILGQGTPGRNPAQEVKSAYASHLKGIESENLTAVLGGYEANPTVVFKGDPPDLEVNTSGLRTPECCLT